MGQFSAQIDVREIEPKEKHPKIFETFDLLKLGQSMELINDHDPKPLQYQLMAEREGQFQWKSLEEGPNIWRVGITKM